MKSPRSIVLLVLVLSSASLFATSDRTIPAAPAHDRQIDVIAVAERFLPIRSTATRPISALVIDAGYAELGYPTKGENLPPPKVLAGAFSAVLATHGFQPATTAQPAAVVLVYHWGSVRPNPFYSGVYNVAGSPSNAKADSTWKYRLHLVAPAWLASRAMERLIEGRTNPLPGAYEPPEIDDIVNHARFARYFAIVSAYDAASVAKGHPALVWRTKLSAETTAGGADEVLPALFTATGPYLGRDHPKPVLSTVALASSATPSAVASPPAALSSDIPLMRILLQDDHDRLFGSEWAGSDSRYAPDYTRSASPGSSAIDSTARRAHQLGTPSGLASFPNRR